MVEVARQLVALAGDEAHHAPIEPLSEQECRILKLFADGRSAATIARKLNISAQTLRNHLHHINRKLRTHTRLEAVTHAQHRGLIDWGGGFFPTHHVVEAAWPCARLKR